MADGPSPHRPQCMQISIQSRPGCFQYNTSAAGPVLIPLYQQPMHCFIQSNALSTMSTWTSGHITEPKKTLKKTQLMRVWQKVSLWKVRSRDKGDKVHAADLKYCHMQKQAGFFCPTHQWKQVPVLLSSLSLNLFCCFLTCFSHSHPLGINNARAHVCTDAPQRAHVYTHVHRCGVIKTHMLPADFLVRTLISAVVTSEGGYGTARHLDTHGILH